MEESSAIPSKSSGWSRQEDERCSRQGGSQGPLPGGTQWGCSSAPGLLHAPHAPAVALSSLVPNSNRAQPKGRRSSCHRALPLTTFFPWVFQETFVVGHAAMSGGAARSHFGGAAVSGVQTCQQSSCVGGCSHSGGAAVSGGAGSPSASPGTAATQLRWHRNHRGSGTASLRHTARLNTA